MNKISLQVL